MEAIYEAGNALYEKLGTREGESLIFKVDKQRANNCKDGGRMTCIRNKQVVIITKDDEIRDRWREYFNKLLNVENEREEPLPTETIEDLIENVTLQEVVAAIKNMKKGKATITSGFSIYFIKVLKEEGEKMVHKMVELIWKEGKMPSE